MSFLDFNSLIICNDDYDVKSLTDTVKYFRDYGIKNFVITYSVYPERFSQSEIINSCKSAKIKLLNAAPRNTHLRIYPNVHISNGTLRNPFINRLKIRATNMIFAELPMFCTDTLNADINYLLFKQKLFPIFISFETNLVSSSKNFVNTLYKSPNAAFALDLEFMVKSDYEHFVHMLITSKSTIIPCISRNLKCYSDIILQFEFFRQRLGDHAYFKFCKQVDTSCKRIFSCF